MRIEEILHSFDAWNEKKKELNFKNTNVVFKEGEIWWCSWGMNVGEEVYGKGEGFKRPAIILRKLSRTSCIVLPITSQARDGSWYHFIDPQNNPRWVMMHQIKFVSSSRLIKRQFVLTDEEFFKLKESEAELLGLSIKSSPEFPLDRWVTPNVLLVYNNGIHIAMQEYEEYAKLAL